jgi:hypothetical protein
VKRESGTHHSWKERASEKIPKNRYIKHIEKIELPCHKTRRKEVGMRRRSLVVF